MVIHLNVFEQGCGQCTCCFKLKLHIGGQYSKNRNKETIYLSCPMREYQYWSLICCKLTFGEVKIFKIWTKYMTKLVFCSILGEVCSKVHSPFGENEMKQNLKFFLMILHKCYDLSYIVRGERKKKWTDLFKKLLFCH